MVLVGSAGIYYAFFTVFFLFVAGSFGWIRTRRSALLWSALALAGVIVLSSVVNLAPDLLYRAQNGANTGAVDRGRMGPVIYGLKLGDMVLPVDGHRLPVLARLKADYHRGLAGIGPVLDNEATWAALGLLGSLGLFIALGGVALSFAARAGPAGSPGELLVGVSVLTWAGFLLATVGGVGMILGFVLPMIRAYNRISVFLAFLALVALGVAFDWALRRARLDRTAAVTWALAAVLVAFGLWDTVSPAFVPDYTGIAQQYHADARFVAGIQSAVPKGGMVFQLPYMPFPEAGPLYRELDYDPFRAYLHSSSVRWSYGAVKGRPVARWQRRVSRLPVPRMVAELKRAGFSGIWVDTAGYASQDGAAAVAELSRATGTQASTSSDGVFRYVPIR
jgi:phosphoglycerol transferase